VSPPQQSVVTVQAAPELPQAASHVCVVALQEREQQFPFDVQLAPFGEHVAHMPPMHAPGPAQQVDGAAAQLTPLARHVVVEVQTVPAPSTRRHLVPAQHVSFVVEHDAPAAVHVPPLGAAQRRTPEASGTHGEPPQHWSLNWQTWPVWMQQFGLFASQPAGHAVVPPPKQRMMPFESALQTAFLPSQQFWEALTVPLPPQMLPGGLQLWPFVQPSGAPACFGVQVTP
jgi:hypothetical protein